MDSAVSAKNLQAARCIAEDVTAVPFSRYVILQDFAQDSRVMGQAAVTAVLHTFFHSAFHQPVITTKFTIANKDNVSMAMTLSGQQIAPFWGLPCTGREITLLLAIVCQFYGEQITHIDLFYDAGSLLRQLGLAL